MRRGSKERERDGGWDPARERERRENEGAMERKREKLQWVRGRDGARGKTERGKMKAMMIYEMGREIRGVGGDQGR